MEIETLCRNDSSSEKLLFSEEVNVMDSLEEISNKNNHKHRQDREKVYFRHWFYF